MAAVAAVPDVVMRERDGGEERGGTREGEAAAGSEQSML